MYKFHSLTFLLLTLFAPSLLAANPVPKAPDIAATSYLIEDFNSGQAVASKEPDKKVEPASITKLISGYVIFHELRDGNLALSDSVLISKKAWRTPGSRMFVEVDTKVSVADLLKGMIIQSGNDATVALAEKVAGTEASFAGLMNEHARKLGMSNSHFTNSTGLPDPDHYTTASDIAKISRAMISEFPGYYKWYAEKEFTYNGIKQNNRNKLLWRDDTVDGIKTGHTDAAGYCLVTSAKREEMRLITVILGTKSENARTDASQSLLNYGFRFFETHKLYDAQSKLTNTRVWQGAANTIDLGLQETLYVTVPRGQYNNLDASMQIGEQIMAPVGKGVMLGRVMIRLGEQVVADKELIALTAVEEGSLWQKLVDKVLLYFE